MHFRDAFCAVMPNFAEIGHICRCTWERYRDFFKMAAIRRSHTLHSAKFRRLLTLSWWRGTVVERQSLTGELSLSCARPAADG